MAVTFVVVPQWQGSGSARAMQLVDGAEAILGDLPAASTRRIEVPLEAGDAEGTGILRHSSLRLVRERIEQELAELDGPAVLVGGDCGVDHAGVVRSAAGGPVALLWLDAHADANSPATSSSHAFHGMVLRALVEEGVVPADRVVLAGTRAWDDAEAEWARAAGVRTVDIEGLRAGDPLAEALAATGAARVHIHVDLDVLDPGELAGLDFPEPFGLSVAELVAAIGVAAQGRELAGAAITEFSPASPAAAGDDLGAILRIVGALARTAR
ncbi:arginase family protein [Homoserinibacter sp. YIM 151385]|uniref:arginase family protein n=1 Tax=Homoserinibacter sp. YIM 151385 TaxID=2985506 RepID=UPI0022F0FAEB|nr:arginase family protein [Homoserinibacter sp. YIM 151385]WBU38263.1 arginase family protein [Homoserinibacter sp. YIM 151385]